jgi:hypothetical protein
MKYQDDYHYDYYAEHKEETRIADKNCQSTSFSLQWSVCFYLSYLYYHPARIGTVNKEER